ncbi:helix-turn-helix domain-containing protein [Priestia megaterium]|uniref:helix-turn-helix domain-containing protein n=1 Tax=Priestia megaterium TaxID=1404 RepID=UPI00209F16D4|nr:helix-turn-helix transcriptional regulator [Priestia megaterium]MCP1447905.1 transcriptional regulator with XRE-family HTH domain [Priestia megaterium]
MNLGEQLQKLREEKKMSREELAGEMNVSRQAVYKQENNKGYPDIENLIKLRELYDVTLDELIKGDQKFQKKIAIDEEEEEPSTPGFVIGIIIVFIGIFFDWGKFSFCVSILGFAIMLFYNELKQTFWNIKKDFKEER